MTTPLFAAAGAGLLLLSAAPASLAGDLPPPPPAVDAPPGAHPGQCFQKYVRPDEYETVRQQVVDQPARVFTRIVPAEYRWEDRQVLVTPGRIEEHAVPEVAHDVTETVVARPGGMRVETTPPVYDTVVQRVMTRPARTYWKPSWGPTGEIMCLVTEPAIWCDQAVQALRQPARQIQTPIPAEYRTVVRHVVDAPAHVDRQEIAPEYRTDHVRVLVTPERTETNTTPASYHTVEHRRLVSAGGLEWRPIACAPPKVAPCDTCGAPPPPPVASPCSDGCASTPIEPRRRRHWHEREHRMDHSAPVATGAGNVTAEIQTALRQRGYYKGAVDGLYTADTMHALGAYERDNHMPPGPPTTDVARSLGVF